MGVNMNKWPRSVFGGVDVNNQPSVFALACDWLDMDKQFRPLCHIPSNAVRGSRYDAMLVTERPSHSRDRTASTVTMLLYDASQASDASRNGSVYVQQTSTHPLRHQLCSSNQFIFCQQRSSLVYEHDAKLYSCAVGVGGLEINELQQNKKMFVKSLRSIVYV